MLFRNPRAGHDIYCTRFAPANLLAGTSHAQLDAMCGAANGGLLTCAAGGCGCSADCEATQREALLALKPAEGSAALAAWHTDGRPCANDWPGVTCDVDLLVTRLDLHGVRLGGDVAPLAGLGALSYLDLNGTAATGWPLATTDGCCTFVDAARPYCVGQPGAAAACVPVIQAGALLAFKASGGAATATALASWQPGTDPCGVPEWAGVTCSGGAAPAVTMLELYGNSGKFGHVAGQIGTLAPLAADLTRLVLEGPDATGDVAGLAPLVELTHLILHNTKKVTGRAAALAPLSRLTFLDLEYTAVTGCDDFCGAGGPFHSHCDPTCGTCDC
jgi:hypothetical protein